MIVKGVTKMKVQKTIFVIAVALILAALCYGGLKITEIKPGVTVQWPRDFIEIT